MNDKINSWKKAGRTFDQSLVLAWFVQLLLAIQFIHKKYVDSKFLKNKTSTVARQCVLVLLGNVKITTIVLCFRNK